MHSKFQHVDFTNSADISANLSAMIAEGRRHRALYLGNLVRKGIAKLGGLLAGLRAHTKRYAAYRELMALDDRMLNDIGLTRSDLKHHFNNNYGTDAANSNRAGRNAA